MVSGHARLKNKHAGVEVKSRGLAQFGGPLHLFWTLLTVPYLVLRTVTPCLLTETVHHGVKVTVR